MLLGASFLYITIVPIMVVPTSGTFLDTPLGHYNSFSITELQKLVPDNGHTLNIRGISAMLPYPEGYTFSMRFSFQNPFIFFARWIRIQGMFYSYNPLSEYTYNFSIKEINTGFLFEYSNIKATIPISYNFSFFSRIPELNFVLNMTIWSTIGHPPLMVLELDEFVLFY